MTSSARADLSDALITSISEILGPDAPLPESDLRESEFSDFQSGVAFRISKHLKKSPHEIAEQIAHKLTSYETWITAEASGPGFVNINVENSWIEKKLLHELTSDSPDLSSARSRVVVDFSSPNVAKEMHVGHLRTTIVGDAICNLLEKSGNYVIRQNHIGDWGTPFGMLIEHLIDVGEESEEAKHLNSSPNDFYQKAREKYDASLEFAERSRSRVVALQSGDAETLSKWESMLDLSRHYFRSIYRQLDVSLKDEHLAGESSYNSRLNGICDELENSGIATLSEGALCVFLEGYLGKDGSPQPIIIRKSDGGYGYATTDLAAIKHRVETLKADHLIYVVGSSQELHFRMIEAVARLAGWLRPEHKFTHLKIGNVLGEDGKILRTRSGASIKLASLLDEAITRATEQVSENRPGLDYSKKNLIGWQVGIGAIKYADLSISHNTDYMFDLENMLAFQGNTGPYIQYSATRIKAILRKVKDLGIEPDRRVLKLEVSEERKLALLLLSYENAHLEAAETLQPHRVAAYLYEVSQAFATFYERCPVLRAPSEVERDSRITLSLMTLQILVSGLSLLGISTPDEM